VVNRWTGGRRIAFVPVSNSQVERPRSTSERQGSQSESFEDDGDDLSVRVTGSVDGGFRVSVALSAASRCAQLEQQIEALRVAIDLETDINLRKQPISALQRALAEFRALGCVSIVDVGPAVEVASLFAPLHAGRTRGKPEAAEEPEVPSTRDGD